VPKITKSSDWESFSTAFIKRSKDSYGSHIFERLTAIKQEEQTEMEACGKEMETSSVFLKERANILEMKHMLHKILNEEGDPRLNKTKIAMEESGSKCVEAEAGSWTKKVELPAFDRSIEGEAESKGNSFKCDGYLLQFLKSESRSKEGSIIKTYILCGREETKNDVKLARETKIMTEEEVDASIKRLRLWAVNIYFLIIQL